MSNIRYYAPTGTTEITLSNGTKLVVNSSGYVTADAGLAPELQRAGFTPALEDAAVLTTSPSGGVAIALPGGTNANLQLIKGKKIAILGNSIVAQNVIPNGSGITGWAKSTAKVATNTIIPTHMILSPSWSHLYFTCTQGGTTGTVEPMWPSTVGQTVTDGTVVWQATGLRTDSVQFGLGYWTMAQQLSGQRLDEVYIAGRSGQQSPDIIQYVDNALSLNPDVVYFANVFENDTWPGVAPTLSTILANWNAAKAQMDRVRAAGKIVMLQTVFPDANIDSTSVFTGYVAGAGTKAWNWLNEKIRDYARQNPDVIFWDAAGTYIDGNPANPVYPENTATYLSLSGTGQYLKKTDGVHPYMAAIWLLANSLATVLQNNFPAVDRFCYAGDSYAVAVNPLNYGTAGTAGAGITSGTPANSFDMNAYGTVTTAAISQVARTDRAGNWEQSTYVATAADNLSYSPHNSTNMGGAFAVGDVIQSFAEVKILANPTLLKLVYHWMRIFATPNLDFYSISSNGANDQDLGQFITADTVFTHKTVPFQIQTGALSFNTFTRVYGRGAANFTAQFGRISTSKTAIPDIA